MGADLREPRLQACAEISGGAGVLSRYGYWLFSATAVGSGIWLLAEMNERSRNPVPLLSLFASFLFASLCARLAHHADYDHWRRHQLDLLHAKEERAKATTTELQKTVEDLRREVARLRPKPLSPQEASRRARLRRRLGAVQEAASGLAADVTAPDPSPLVPGEHFGDLAEAIRSIQSEPALGATRDSKFVRLFSLAKAANDFEERFRAMRMEVAHWNGFGDPPHLDGQAAEREADAHREALLAEVADLLRTLEIE